MSIRSIVLETIAGALIGDLGIDPDTICLDIPPVILTTWLEFPGVNTIDSLSQYQITSAVLNGSVQSLPIPPSPGDYDTDGIPDITIQFATADLIPLLDTHLEMLRVSGNITLPDDEVAFYSAGAVATLLYPTIAVNYPYGGEKLCVNTNCSIDWESLCFTASVKIEYSTDGGQNWTVVTPSTPNDGSYTWSVPNQPSTHCRIRISDAVDGDPSGTSFADFTISDGDFTVATPNGGEILFSGNQYQITWSSACFTGYVRITLSTNGGVSYDTLIHPFLPNTGVYSWSVPYLDSSTCRVKVCDAVDLVPEDASDDDFTITSQFTAAPGLVLCGALALVLLLVGAAVWTIKRRKGALGGGV